MAERHYIIPVWLRAWHWLNALCFLLLIGSGASLHFASPDAKFLLPFEEARLVHNLAGVSIVVFYVAYLLNNSITGNWRQYLPPLRDLVRELNEQNAYVAVGIFKGERPPLVPTRERKFNALQQITYLLVMYGAMPVLIASGLLFLFPEIVPDTVLGVPGLVPVALLHTVVALLLTLFMIGHVYMGSMGTTAGAGFRMMITGWHVEGEHDGASGPPATTCKGE